MKQYPNSQSRSENSENKISLKAFLANYKEVLAFALSVGSSIWLFITNLKVSSNYKEFSANVSSFLSFVEILNVIVLLAAIFMLLRKYALGDKIKQEHSRNALSNLITLEPGYGTIDDEDIKKNSVRPKIERVDNLIMQLTLSIQGFVVVLLFMYSLLSLTDLNKPQLSDDERRQATVVDLMNDSSEANDPTSEYNKVVTRVKQDYYRKNGIGDIESSIKKLSDTLKKITESKFSLTFKGDNEGFQNAQKYLSKRGHMIIDTLKWYQQKKVFLNLIIKDTLIKSREELYIMKKRNESLERGNNLVDILTRRTNSLDRFAVRYLIIEFVENAFNLFSAAFLFIAFQVLFTVTLDKDNRTSKINYWLPFSLAGSILLVNFLGITIGIGSMPLSSTSHLVRLLSGLYNGVGMMLLFGRFIWIEYYYKKEHGFKKYFYYIGTIFILPFYAVVQPLYGIFDLDNKDIGNALILKAVVLLVCFVGKLFLFLYISFILERAWIHSFFYWILLDKDNLGNVSKELHNDIDITY